MASLFQWFISMPYPTPLISRFAPSHQLSSGLYRTNSRPLASITLPLIHQRKVQRPDRYMYL